MHSKTTVHPGADTVVGSKILARDHEPFVSIRLDDDLAILTRDVDFLERLAAECTSAINALQTAQAALEEAA